MPLGSLSFCLHHQGLERDLEHEGAFFSFSFCALNIKMELIEDIGCGQLVTTQRYFSQLEGVEFNVGLQSKN